MDKWKDVELEKMKVGGNRNAREFFKSQSDWVESMSISQRYNTKAAALYRDKVKRFIILFYLWVPLELLYSLKNTFLCLDRYIGERRTLESKQFDSKGLPAFDVH